MNEPTLRRITVEREDDWIRVQNGVDKALMDTMEARLALLPGGRDGPTAKGVRREIEVRIKKVREEAYKLTKPNLRVNGHNYEDFVEATEPWDELIDREVKAQNDERVSAEGEVVRKRRTHPATINKLSKDVETRRKWGEWLPMDDVPVDSDGGKEREIPKPERYQETVDTFTTVASNLSELVQTAPAQLSKATRAHAVREEIAKMGP